MLAQFELMMKKNLETKSKNIPLKDYEQNFTF